MPTISVSRPTVVEGSSNNDLSFNVTLSGSAPGGASVQYRTRPGTAVQGQDYRGASGTLTFAPGETSLTLNVVDFSDSVAEFDESVFLELFDPVGADLPGNLPVLQTIGWIQDNDGTGVDLGLQVLSPTLVEGDSGTRQMIFEISLSEPPATAMTVAYTTSNGSAIAGADYMATSGNVTFAAGQTSAFVTVNVLSDTVNEATETFDLVVTPPAAIGNGADGAVGTGTILNDDAPDSAPTISVARAQVAEGASSADLAFVVTLSDPAPGGVSVQYRTRPGTATEGEDYRGNTGTLTFLPNQTSLTVSVVDFSDSRTEFDESVIFEIFDPVGADLSGGLPTVQAIGWILDNDGVGVDLGLQVSSPTLREGPSGTREMVFELSLSEAPANAITMVYATTNGSAVAGEDFLATSGNVTFAPGQTSQFVTVDVIGDGFIEATEAFGLVVTPTSAIGNGAAGAVGTGTILNDDSPRDLPTISISRADVSEGASSADLRFTVTLSEPAPGGASVQYRTRAGTGTENDYRGSTGTLTFAPGQTVLTLNIVDFSDSLAEFDESMFVELFDPIGAELSGNQPVIQGIGWILDNDGVGVDLGLQVLSPTLIEGPTGSQQMTFELSLSETPANAITLNYNTSNGTAIAGQDYVAASGTVTFAAGQTTAYVMVDILGDLINENVETFNLAVTPTAVIGNGSAGAVGIGTIRNFNPAEDNIFQGSNLRDVIDLGNGDDFVSGRGGNDNLRGGAGNDTILGDNGNDRLFGDSGADFIEGGNGNDTIDGGGRNDTILSGNGDDSVIGLTGNDIIFAGFGNDYVDAGSGNDRIDGGTGEDVLLGGDGRDRVVGRFSNDTVSGGDGADNIFGGQGHDLMFGDGGDDRMIGQIDNDTMFGGSGNDTLSAGDGEDYLNGNAGDDNLIGGAGADVFAFNGAFGTDRIVDFETGGANDRMNLRNLLGVDDYQDLIDDHMRAIRNDVVLINDDGGNRILIFDVTLAEMQNDDLYIF